MTTLIDNSTEIAGFGNSELGGSLYSKTTILYRHNNGQFYTREFGGDAMHVNSVPRWLTREEAIDFVATKATDSITGYGYSVEQSATMVDGGEAGPGYRDN